MAKRRTAAQTLAVAMHNARVAEKYHQGSQENLCPDCGREPSNDCTYLRQYLSTGTMKNPCRTYQGLIGQQHVGIRQSDGASVFVIEYTDRFDVTVQRMNNSTYRTEDKARVTVSIDTVDAARVALGIAQCFVAETL